MHIRELFHHSDSDASFPFLLRRLIYKAVTDTYPIDRFLFEEIKIEKPNNENYGDYSSNIALVISGRLRKKPFDIAKKIKERLDEYIKTNQTITFETDSKIISALEKVEIAGVGFLNLTIQTGYISSELIELLNKRKGDRTIQINTGILAGKKIFIEFAHPNTHKEFHIGHLRNISVGESLVRILQANGAEVFRANYEGDVGLHVAKAIWGVQRKISDEKLEISTIRKLSPSERANFLGQGYALGSKMYEEDESAKKEIIELNKSIYQDPKRVELWDETRRWSLDYFDTVYKRVGTHFDRLFFESEVEKTGRDMVKKAAVEGIFVNDPDGSIYFPGEKYGLNNCVFVTREDYATYEGKEIALEELEYATFPYDLSINVVASEQTNFFQIGYKATEVLFPHHAGKHYHLPYGMVNLKSGKMSSRTGQVITADWLFDQAKEKIKTIILKSREQITDNKKQMTPGEIDEITETVAVAAVKYSMLRVNPLMEIAFDLSESISLEGDSGPYLLYTYARCKSVLRKAEFGIRNSEIRNQQSENRLPISDYRPLNPEEDSLLRSLYRFPEIVAEAGRTLSPNVLCSYLFATAQKYNLFYNKHTILGFAQNEISNSKIQMSNKAQNLKKELTTHNSKLKTDFRLFLTEVTAEIIREGLSLLGIKTVERM